MGRTRYPVTPTTGRVDGPRWHAGCSTCGWQTTGATSADIARLGAVHLDEICTDAVLTVQPVAYVGAGRRG